MRRILELVLSTCLCSPATAATTLHPIDRADMEAATVVGTGCTWSTSDGRLLFAATDDIAVARTGSGLVTMRPHPRARGMFPFTYDRWVGAGVEIQVVETGKPRMIGTELVRTRGTLIVKSHARMRRLSGVLECGS